MEENQIFDVFVSGAGPVGLFFAYQMLRRGHSVFICDIKPGPTDQSRSNLLTSRTLEIFSMHGIAAQFLEECVTTQGMQLIHRGNKVGFLGALDGEYTSFPHGTCVAQDKTEEILINLVQTQQSDSIHWCTRFVKHETYDDHVAVTVEKNDTTTCIRARYLVAADGVHSTVRKTHDGWKYDGYSLATPFALADCKLSGRDADKIRNQRANTFLDDDGYVDISPLGNGENIDYFRVNFNLASFEIAQSRDTTHGPSRRPKENISLEEMQAIVSRRVAPWEVILTEPKWVSVFHINQRKANGFRRGRVFLMGDAAHCFTPLAGHGLNTGVQDAHNLAWKLSFVLGGLCPDPEKLLNSYSSEREPIVKMTMDYLGECMKTGLVKQGSTRAAIGRFFLSSLCNIGWLNKLIMSFVLQTMIALGTDSPVIPAPSCNLIKPGKFIPDTSSLRRRVVKNQIEHKTFHEIMRTSISEARYTALFICTRPSSYDACTCWMESFWFKARKWSSVLCPIIVESTWHAYSNTLPSFVTSDDEYAANAFWLENSFNSSESLTQRIGLGSNLSGSNPPAAIVLIRPDGYIAISSLIHSVEDIDLTFNKFREPLCGYFIKGNDEQ
ncbi:hypothetical protein K492DRAFT_170794 [Lichtheimia hyalospora FSU 10163]|nr:hypothetical protein K492DRAFT_170794 [Lichtheimia hyalospora FSU 10163]